MRKYVLEVKANNAQLLKTLNSKDGEHTKFGEQEEKLLSRIKELNDKCTSKDQSNTNLSNELNNLLVNEEQLKNQNSELDRTVEDLQSKIFLNNQGSSDLQKILIEKDHILRKTKEENKNLTINCEKLANDNSHLQITIVNLKEDIKNYDTNLSQTDAQAKDMIEDYKTTVDILKDQIQSINKQHDDTKKRNDDLKTIVQSKDEDMAQMVIKIEELTNNIASLNSSISDLEKQI